MTYQVTYAGDDVSTVFAFPFAIETGTDCEVLLGGVLQSGNYSVRGQGSIDGGAVVFDAAPVAGTAITLRRRASLLVSAEDAGTGYLSDKLVAGDHIVLDTLSVDGYQRVRISADDITSDDVAATLKAGANIDLSQVTEGGVEYLRIAAKGVSEQLEAGTNITLEPGVDQRVRINATGVAAQLEAGDNVTLSPGTDGRTRINATQPDMSKVLYRDTSAVVEAGFWSKPVALAVTGGVATPDPLAGTVFTLSLTAATTLGFPAGMAGKAGMFLVVAKQDASGGRTLTLASGYALAGGEWSTVANAVNLLWVTSDGSGTALDVVIAQRGV